MDRVSVIIPNYNYGRFIRKAIESALGQTHPPHEVIVIDDGSTDESEAVISSFGDKVVYIKQQNAGVGIARNRGASESSGEYLAFLDADDYWAPEKLEKQLEVFRSDKDVGLVHCGMVNVETDGKFLSEFVDGMAGWVDEHLLRLEPVIVGPGSSSVIKKDIFELVGGYDVDPDLHPSEDWELSYRLARHCKFGYVGEPLLYYRHHGKGGHTNISRMERAMLIGFEKAFAEDTKVAPNLAYGRLFQVLAGSYFRAGMYGDFMRNAAKSVWYRPSGIGYFAAYPLRRLRKTS